MRERYKRVLENAVKRGAAYLDANPDKEEAFEEWYRRINLNWLSLSSSSYCIIGQTLGDYGNLYQVDDFNEWPPSKLTRWAERHGFVVHDRTKRVRRYWLNEWIYETDTEYRDEAYAYLTVLWRDEVESRQLARDLSESLTTTSEPS